MPDFPTSRPVLAGMAALHGKNITLEALPEGHLLQVMGAAKREDLEAALAAADLRESTIREAGYRQWYVVGDNQVTPSALRSFAAALPSGTYMSDQSHGRVRIRLSGDRASERLSTGTAIDLHDATFSAGQSAITLFGHISVHLTRKGAAEFEFIVLRSFAEALYDQLQAFGA